MATGTTKLAQMVDPEVMAPMISAKLEKAIVATPFAKIDTTLVGRPGSTITIPKYEYIGDAEDLAEGVNADKTKLTTTTAEHTIKKAVKQVELTDEAVLSGYGNPVGETNNQLAKSIASKVDNDVMEALKGAQLGFTGSGDISYDNIVDAIDVLKRAGVNIRVDGAVPVQRDNIEGTVPAQSAVQKPVNPSEYINPEYETKIGRAHV